MDSALRRYKNAKAAFKQMPRTRRSALRRCLDAGVRSASAIYREEEGERKGKVLALVVVLFGGGVGF